MSKKEIQVCQRCVMDSTDPQIFFDKNGFCNHCTDFLKKLDRVKTSLSQKTEILNQKIKTIKKDGKAQEYDCIIGISGGVDSTYLAYLTVKEFGLRPLAVHLDNGWNSKLAVKNIKNIVNTLDIDLFTHVIDWEEFKSLQLAYLKASVLDIEALTDHAIMAIMLRAAAEHNIKWVLKGFNNNTETIIPKSWTFNKADFINIVDINKKFGTVPIKTFPLLSDELIKTTKINSFAPLNYVDFNLTQAKEIIQNELKWVDYGGKHYESIFTRFYQGYILPRKFNIDKRKAHYSSMICTEVMNRDEAIEKLKGPTYDPELMKQDYDYVVKKFELTENEFEAIMNQPVRSHFDYKTSFKSKLNKKYINPKNPLVRMVKNSLM